MAKSDSALRRRDKIKSISRYSPPPIATSTGSSSSSGGRDRRKFPSTYSRSSQNNSNNNNNSSSGNAAEKSCPIDVQRDGDGGKMLITLPDGTTYRVDATPVTGSAHKRKSQITAEDDDLDEDAIIETGIDDPADDDYEPTYGQRRRISRPSDSSNNSSSRSSSGRKAPVRRSAAASTAIVKEIARPPRPPVNSANSKSSTDEMRTTAIRCTMKTGVTKVTYIAAPKAITLTAAFKQPPKRNYGTQSKFIDDLPDLSDCTDDTFDESVVKYEKTPDTMLLIQSDLPLQYCTSISLTSSSSVPTSSSSNTTTSSLTSSSSTPSKTTSTPTNSTSPQSDGKAATTTTTTTTEKVYAFRQILSPYSTSYPCLLCPQRSAGASRSEVELKAHYSMFHELTVAMAVSKVSDEVVYVCLPKASLTDIQDGHDVELKVPCQFCDNIILTALSSLIEHYENMHGNTIQLIDQEMILKMHEHLYCFTCDQISFEDFKSLNRHMREVHHMHTFPCKSCSFFTRDETRLKSHYKAKHMMNNSTGAGGNNQAMQCTECAYCNGLLLGTERMSRHILTTHCIQTAPGQYSCIRCLQLAGPPDNLISHPAVCPALAKKGSHPSLVDQQKDAQDEDDAVHDQSGSENSNSFPCFLCDSVFSSQSICQLHLDHKHTKWVSRSKRSDDELIKVQDLPSIARLQKAGIEAAHGFYCSTCDLVIEVYPLYYLHMANFHSQEKTFQCKVSSCSQSFTSSDGLSSHMRDTSHPQASVMEDTLGAICCHFCDMYFKDRKEFELHHLTDQHADRMPSISDTKSFVAGRQEARNFKCKTCHTWFGLTDSFFYHMENETHKHACPYCGIDFALPSSRRTHIQSHHTEKTDFCEVCGTKQGTKERVVAHLVTHGIVFECNTCMKKFYQREQLNSHSETHGPAVECRWSGCNKKIIPSSLTAHIKQHRMEKNSKCIQCNKSFASKAALDAHKEVHVQAEISARAILSQSAAAVSANAANVTMAPCSSSSSNMVASPVKSGAVVTTTDPVVTATTETGETTVISISYEALSYLLGANVAEQIQVEQQI